MIKEIGTLARKDLEKMLDSKVYLELFVKVMKNWREKESTRDAVKIAIRDFLWDERTGLPIDFYDESEVISRSGDVYRHIFSAYPTLPSPIYP